MKLEAGFKNCFGFIRNTKLWPGFLENSTGPRAGGSSFSVCVRLLSQCVDPGLHVVLNTSEEEALGAHRKNSLVLHRAPVTA